MRELKELPLFDRALDQMQAEAHGPHLRLIAAQVARLEAIAAVDKNANKEWMAAFRRALEVVARQKLRFTADDVWEQLEKDYHPLPEQHEPRAAGAVVVRAIKDGVIVTVKNMFWNSRRKSCHNRPIQVYQSLIFK